MIVALENAKGEKIELDIPMSLADITFLQFVKMRKAEENYFKQLRKAWVKEQLADNPELEEENIDLDAFKPELAFEQMLMALEHVVKGPIDKLSPKIEATDAKVLFEGNYMLNENSLNKDFTLFHLYAHVVSMINTYSSEITIPQDLDDKPAWGKLRQVPNDYSVMIGDKEYVIQTDEALACLTGAAFTSGEAVTVLQFQKDAGYRVNKDGDRDGMIEFNLGLAEVATILRPKGEKLPWNRRKRITYIDKQKKIMQRLPMNVIGDVRFFLLAILLNYGETQITSSFGSLRNEAMLEVTQSVQQRTQKSKKQSGKWLDGIRSLMSPWSKGGSSMKE